MKNVAWSEIAFMVYLTILSQVRSCWIYYFHVTKTLFQNFQSFTMIFLLPWLQVSCNCKLYNPPKNLCSVNREERVKSEEWLVAWRREKRRSTWKRRQRTIGQDCPKCKETQWKVNVIDFEFFGFDVSIWVPWSHLGPKKSWYIGRIIQIDKICGEKHGTFCSISKISLKSLIVFPDFSDVWPSCG